MLCFIHHVCEVDNVVTAHFFGCVSAFRSRATSTEQLKQENGDSFLVVMRLGYLNDPVGYSGSRTTCDRKVSKNDGNRKGFSGFRD